MGIYIANKINSADAGIRFCYMLDALGPAPLSSIVRLNTR